MYLNRGISRTQLVALYALADDGWVNPLRDGGDGVLVLSELTGAAAEMGEGCW